MEVIWPLSELFASIRTKQMSLFFTRPVTPRRSAAMRGGDTLLHTKLRVSHASPHRTVPFVFLFLCDFRFSPNSNRTFLSARVPRARARTFQHFHILIKARRGKVRGSLAHCQSDFGWLSLLRSSSISFMKCCVCVDEDFVVFELTACGLWVVLGKTNRSQRTHTIRLPRNLPAALARKLKHFQSNFCVYYFFSYRTAVTHMKKV